MRAARIVSLLLLLQARGRLTAAQLADELDVSVRTVYRDVEALHAAGVPLYGAAGHAGGYRLVEGYRTRLTGFTAGEARSLFLTSLPGPAQELGLGAEVTGVWRKLTASLPPDLREGATRVRQRFHLDAAGWYTAPDPVPALGPAADAVWRERRVRLRYRRWEAPREVTRVLDPYGLVLKAGRWYLVAGPGPRTYRVSQIQSLEVLDEGFTRPAEFDLAAHWESCVDDFDRRRHVGSAVVRLAPAVLGRLEHVLDAASCRAITETGVAGADGWVTATIPVEEDETACAELLRLGTDAEVLAPERLRRRMAATVEALAARYSATAPR
ncbi:helix-turn-helix transcriptional regulator [Actinophytocola xanthii]|uniref:Transcriptional regulator n=1 Tax=Actinophytocola xanthii TaxID=1912961 RepID=A0A1Q8CGP9_9PSEU|nr:WYL domain-containing protein [Actinophytocola xanthii]OLF13547.1 transcriptional regulator [Actinophytocola xanthii]